MNKHFLATALLALTFLGSGQFATARENPFISTKCINLSADEKAQYIDKKTTQLFSPTVAARPALDKYKIPANWKREQLTFNQVTVEKYTPKKKSDRIVLFMHGGGYVGGLHNRYRDWGISLAANAGNATLLAVDYRYAPKNVFPAALDDAAAAYKGIIDAGYDPEKMILIGDSAGGNLAAALAVYIRDNKLPMPKAMILISPWTSATDLPSRKIKYQQDMILGAKNKRLAPEVAEPSYFKNADKTNPYASPVYADLTGMPATFISAGGDELLLDDTILYAAYARAAGVKIKEIIYPNMSHDWTILLPELPETCAMKEEMAKFIDEQLGK